MKKLFLIFLLLFVSFGLFAETIFERDHDNRYLKIEKQKEKYIVSTSEETRVKGNYIVYQVTLLNATYDDIIELLFMLTEDNDFYYETFETARSNNRDIKVEEDVKLDKDKIISYNTFTLDLK